MRRGTRTPEEDIARSQARSFCLREGAKIFKMEGGFVRVTECTIWPEGLITVFHGWQDVVDRLTRASSEPELVTGGFLILEGESKIQIMEEYDNA